MSPNGGRFIGSLLAVGLVATAPAVAAGPGRWVGEYPSHRVDGKSLWETIGPALDAAIGPRLADTIRRGWGPEIPVIAIESWVLAYVCKARDCGDNNVTIAIGPDARLIACTFVNDDKDPGSWRQAGRPPKPLNEACPPIESMVPAMRRAGLIE